jgi:peptide/nickel transport system substrate-binding protein
MTSTRKERGMRKASYIAMLAGLAVLAAGCGGTNSSPTGQTGASTVGTTLTFASSIPPTTINPALSQDAVPEEWYDDIAYEPFIVADANGSLSPGLAVSWGYVGTGNTTFVMNLRPHVRFSDGSALTAAGAKADIDYMMTNPGNGQYLHGVKAINVLGPLKLEIQLSTPDAALPYTFTQNHNPGWVISPAGLADKTGLASSTHGAGPYMLDAAATIADSSYVFVRNPYYYDKAAVHWQKVVIKVISDPSAALAALTSGQIQVMQGEYSQVSTAQSSGYNVTSEPGTFGPVTISVADASGKTAPQALGSLKVRQALAYALDRPAIMTALYGKYWLLDEEQQTPGQVGYVPALADEFSYNLAKARQLMAQAGYPHGFSAAISCSPQLGQALACDAVKAAWARIGVNLTVSAPPQNVWVTQITSGKYQFVGVTLLATHIAIQATFFEPSVTNGFTVIPGLQAALNTANSQAAGSAQAAQDWAKVQSIEMNFSDEIVLGAPDVLMFSAKGIRGIDYSSAEPVPYPLTWYPG